MSWRIQAGWFLRRLRYRGAGRYCVVCGSHVRRFLDAGAVTLRPDVGCPVCGSLERHRLAWAFFERRTDLFDGRKKRLLHIAPEPAFTERFRRIPAIDYVSADMNNPRAMVKMDITQIEFPDDAFDVIHCSHVLEHVTDDRRAMRELRRVLRPTGWAVLQVPIVAERTDEDPAVTDPAERERRFGQFDHVRAYGPDYAERLIEARFAVRAWKPDEFLSDSEIQAFRVDPAERVFACRKAPVGPAERTAR